MALAPWARDVLRAVVHWFASWFLYWPPRVPFVRWVDLPVVETHRPDAPRYAVIYFHGNAGLAHVPEFLKDQNVSVYAPEYNGYGPVRTRTCPSEADVYGAALRAYECARTDGFESGRIVIWGRSLGGAPAAYLASRRECAALIMDSAFASVLTFVHPWIADVAMRAGVDVFPNARYIGETHARHIAFVHSRSDNVIPWKRHLVSNWSAVDTESARIWYRNGCHNAEIQEPIRAEIFEWLAEKMGVPVATCPT